MAEGSRLPGRRDVVAIGASAGGVEALRTLIAGLPADFPACVLVVLHLPPGVPSALARILARAGTLPVDQATPDSPLRPGRLLVAPPDRHLVVFARGVTVSRGPRENGHRPAVDVLFRSAARSLGSRVIGVVLSGALDDGTAGLAAIRARGGVGVVQDPHEAAYPGMPMSAIDHGLADHVVPVADLPGLLVRLLAEPQPGGPGPSPESEADADIDADIGDPTVPTAVGTASGSDPGPDQPGAGAAVGLSCPDCHGAMLRFEVAGLLQFRCRVGHVWSPESLVAQHTAALEGAFWVALRTLEEKAAISLEMGARAHERGHELTAARLREQHDEARTAARLVRDLIDRVADGGVAITGGSAWRPGARD